MFFTIQFDKYCQKLVRHQSTISGLQTVGYQWLATSGPLLEFLDKTPVAHWGEATNRPVVLPPMGYLGRIGYC